jgi:hypothetical protein
MHIMDTSSGALVFGAEFFGILSVLALCIGIGFSVAKSVRLLRGERRLQRRIANQMRIDQLTRLIEQMSHDPQAYAKVVSILENQLALMEADPQRVEMLNALRQATERGRRAYAEKLLREAVSGKEMASH